MRVKVTREEYEKTEDQSRVATMVLNSKDFEFIRAYLKTAFDYAEHAIITNQIHDVTEEVTVSDRIKKFFFTPKKEQVDELKGQYKFIEKFFADLEYFASLKTQLDEDIAKGRVIVEGGKKDVNYAK